MAISDNQKVDFLWKKIAFGKTETDITGKFGFNETISSPVATYSKDIWAESESVPSTAPYATTGVVEYITVQCTADPTVSGNKSWLATTTFNNTSTHVGDWVDPTFEAGYLVGVYDGDPDSGGTALNQGTDNSEWVFDYISGTLHFPNNVQNSATEVWIRGHRYVGNKGLSAVGQLTPYTEFYADITARNSDSAVLQGTLAVVTDNGDGESATYVANANGPTTNWTLISTEDSAGSDAKTLQYTITPSDDGTPVTLGNASSGSRVIDIIVDVDVVFDGTPAMTVGTSGDNDLLVTDAEHDLSDLGNYQVTSNHKFTNAVDEDILIYFTANGAATGSAVVTLTFA